MDSFLKISNLHKHYKNGTHALKGINLSVKKGEFLVLLGLSGSGKSTLLRCIIQLISSNSGEIIFKDQNLLISKGEKKKNDLKKIAMIFQQFNLIKNLSVLTNVLSGRLGSLSLLDTLFPKANKQLKTEALKNIARVSLSEFAEKKVSKLSGGQQQRVAIARALMQKPELILADEPVASLDPATADSVMKYLSELNKKDHITIICSLHFLSLARKYGSRVIALKDGNIVFDGSAQEIDEKKFKEIYGKDAEEVEIR